MSLQAVRFPPPMSLLASLLAVALARDTVPPYLAFPEPGLDDPAAYEGYQTRVYQDASGNAFQVYVKSDGRVVNLWADAANESVGFTVRDSSGKPAELAWGSAGAVVERSAAGGTRSVAYALEAPSTVKIGLLLLGSMRVERDFGYGERDSLPLDAPAFVQPELTQLIDHIAKLKPAERARHLALLGVKSLEALRARLSPRINLQRGDTVWNVAVEQPSFDGKSHLWLALQGDTRETVPAVSGNVVTIRRPAGGAVRWSVRVTTDAAALTPLTRKEIFDDDFDRFAAQVRADTAHPLRWRRLEREIRGSELLSYREKMMAGLPNFATYFGRDMLMTALLMQPVWAPAMPEHVIASALEKLAPDGDVSHEEALGSQAIRENAAEYNRLVAAGQLARQPGGVRGGPVRDGRERHLGAARPYGRRDHPRCPEGARSQARDSRGTARGAGARPRGGRAGGGHLEGGRAPFPGIARAGRGHETRRGQARVAPRGGACVLGRRPETRARHPAVSRALARRGGAADPHRQHRSRDGAAARLARYRPDPRARGADPAAVPRGPVRGRRRPRGRERCLRRTRRMGGVPPRRLSLAHRRVGPGCERAARRIGAAAPPW